LFNISAPAVEYRFSAQRPIPKTHHLQQCFVRESGDGQLPEPLKNAGAGLFGGPFPFKKAYFFRGTNLSGFVSGTVQANETSPKCPKTTPLPNVPDGRRGIVTGLPAHLLPFGTGAVWKKGDVSGTMRRVKLEHAVS